MHIFMIVGTDPFGPNDFCTGLPSVKMGIYQPRQYDQIRSIENLISFVLNLIADFSNGEVEVYKWKVPNIK